MCPLGVARGEMTCVRQMFLVVSHILGNLGRIGNDVLGGASSVPERPIFFFQLSAVGVSSLGGNRGTNTCQILF